MKKIEPIAKIHTVFPEKFGIPRQSGLANETYATIVFEPKYRNADALIGIELYDYLWLIWDFSENKMEKFRPMVTPPRLGGIIKKGVFATRSPFRPNGLGLSSVQLIKVEEDEQNGMVLHVAGADLLDHTPIYDIKPYLAYTDAHPDAKGSFGEEHKDDEISVVFPEELLLRIPNELQRGLLQVLKQDPRAAYHKKPDYMYGMAFREWDIRFKVEGSTLRVCDIVELGNQSVK